MKVSIEISYYPLLEDYKPTIKNFIAALEANPAITVKPNSMSTHVFGEFDQTMSAVTQCIKDACEVPSSIFVLKVMNLDRNK